MLIKLLLLSLILVSCGREVKLSSSTLEQFSSITEVESKKVFQNGTLLRASKNGEFDYLKTSSGNYKISAFSSNDTFKFLAATAPGKQVTVKFKGIIKNQEIVVETLEKN